MTQTELLKIARKGRPNVRYAASKSGDAIGGWDAAKGRFVMVAGRLITGEWCSMPYELLVDGKPPIADSDWIE